MKTENLPLGTKVNFDQKFYRTKRLQRDGDSPFNLRYREWKAKPAHYGKCGIIVGVRSLQNGIVSVEDGIKVFEPKEFIKAYLVAVDLSLNPFYVPYDNVVPII